MTYTYTNYSVNERGLNQIKDILISKHKTFRNEPDLLDLDKNILHAWASDVEQSLDNGNGASFEISAHDHVMGWVEVCDLDKDSYDVKIVEEE